MVHHLNLAPRALLERNDGPIAQSKGFPSDRPISIQLDVLVQHLFETGQRTRQKADANYLLRPKADSRRWIVIATAFRHERAASSTDESRSLDLLSKRRCRRGDGDGEVV